MLYYCKGPSTLLAVHTHEQTVDPVANYGAGTYVVSDKYGSPKIDPQTKKYLYPDPITAQMQSESVKLECGYRITRKVSETAQRNMTAYATGLQQKEIGGTTLTPEETADMQTYFAIFNWIGRPNGMQAAADAMITSGDMEWYQDVKWPPWNSAWDAFVARF
jgi:hypothetical protein